MITGNPVLAKGDRSFARNFNTSAFALPRTGTFGNASRTVLRGPGVNNWDLAVFKNFPVVKERVRLQFRSEFFNAWNKVNLGQPVPQLNNRSFGHIQTAGDPRILQFALRYVF